MLHDARKILVGLRYGIGDVVMELPVLAALRCAAPDAEITVLGASPATELLEREPVADRVECVRRWGLTHRWDEGPPGAEAEIARWLEGEGFDLALNALKLPPPLSRAILDHGIATRESDADAEMRALAEGACGVAAIRAGAAAGWGLRVPGDARPRLDVRADEREYARRFLTDHGGDLTPVGLSPVASLSLKRWPVERLAALADWMMEETGRTLLLFHGPQRSVGDALVARLRRPERVVRVGALHLRAVAALLERCHHILCNDTGLMHVAAACGTPTVGVFGPTAPRTYRPPWPHAASVGGEAIECPHRSTRSLQPPGCWGTDRCLIGERGCIEQVSVAEVKAALRPAMEEPRSAAARRSAGCHAPR